MLLHVQNALPTQMAVQSARMAATRRQGQGLALSALQAASCSWAATRPGLVCLAQQEPSPKQEQVRAQSAKQAPTPTSLPPFASTVLQARTLRARNLQLAWFARLALSALLVRLLARCVHLGLFLGTEQVPARFVRKEPTLLRALLLAPT